MTKKVQRGLGRGLGALLGDAADTPEVIENSTAERVEMLPIDKIDPNREQPRRKFDDDALEELAQSIRSVGVLQPIIVTANKDRYQIIAGERRYRACRLADITEIPAIVRNMDEQTRLEAALIENLQRSDLNPVEEALGIRSLMEQAGLTQETAAQRLGKSRPAVANLLRILTLPESVLELIYQGKLSAGHARALVGLEPARQEQLAKLAVEQGWSVRQMERICAEPIKQDKPQKPKPLTGEIGQLESMARELFGTRVKLDGDENKGKISLYYFNADDLQRIWDVIEMAHGEH